MRSVWLLTNGTLIVPVLLSLAVLYVALKNVDQERAELLEIRKDLLSREQALERKTSEHMMELGKSQLELLKLLKAPENSSAEKK